jgi:hypothetical protein
VSQPEEPVSLRAPVPLAFITQMARFPWPTSATKAI